MKTFKDIIISKGKKAKIGPVHTRDITIRDLIECFIPKLGNEYSYLGYAYYSVKQDNSILQQEIYLKEFFIEVDKVTRPKWCPKFFLRLLRLFGNDNSIIRVRNRRLHNLFNKITKGVCINDTKWKWDSFRIYGNFTKELDELAKATCRKIEDNDKK
jgi:hypothetical protein